MMLCDEWFFSEAVPCHGGEMAIRVAGTKEMEE